MSPPQQVNVKLNGNVLTYLIVEPHHSSVFLISSLLYIGFNVFQLLRYCRTVEPKTDFTRKFTSCTATQQYFCITKMSTFQNTNHCVVTSQDMSCLATETRYTNLFQYITNIYVNTNVICQSLSQDMARLATEARRSSRAVRRMGAAASIGVE